MTILPLYPIIGGIWPQYVPLRRGRIDTALMGCQVGRSPAIRERIPFGWSAERPPDGCENPPAEERAEADLGAWINSTGRRSRYLPDRGDRCPSAHRGAGAITRVVPRVQSSLSADRGVFCFHIPR
ncbi:hypothetical protein B8V81_1090 [Paenibacillus pasadenensis]|uniref:Uncharacterized protein n=1 Tax=Paenibacillus pasadenensis TaxID=217090 RepID=A0A2N5N934_9BACL|nr:hypothetical protein B8V81_1090 [Paenibacillus pasadenensis]